VLGAACSMAIRQNGGVARSGTVPFRNASHYIRGVGVLVSIIYASIIYAVIRLHGFRSDGDEIWQDSSSSKCA